VLCAAPRATAARLERCCYACSKRRLLSAPPKKSRARPRRARIGPPSAGQARSDGPSGGRARRTCARGARPPAPPRRPTRPAAARAGAAGAARSPRLGACSGPARCRPAPASAARLRRAAARGLARGLMLPQRLIALGAGMWRVSGGTDPRDKAPWTVPHTCSRDTGWQPPRASRTGLRVCAGALQRRCAARRRRHDADRPREAG